MKFLIQLIIAMLAIQSASAQALWRNFFTTNQNPIVEVVAGSNATVQASTVGVNLRRFTVNSIPGGTAPVQTNISWTAVTNLQSSQMPYTVITNAPWQMGDADLTNWGTLNTNVLSTLGQTNISLSAVTNANYLTNWATINTNTYVVKTGDTVSGPILTTSSTSNNPSATELVTANWVRQLFNSGADYYNTTNIDSGATNVGSSQPVYKFQSTIPISDARSYTTADFLTNGGYIGSVVTTNTFSQISGAALVTAFLGFTGGVGGPTLTLHPELYYSYDKTNWYGDWSASDESIINGITNIYQWDISIPVTTSTNSSGFYMMRRFKVNTVTGAGVRTLTVLIGTNAVSGPSTAGHVTMESPTATAGNAFLANNQVFTGSNYFTQPLTLSLATNTPSASQVLTATSGSSAAWKSELKLTNTIASDVSTAPLVIFDQTWQKGSGTALDIPAAVLVNVNDSGGTTSGTNAGTYSYPFSVNYYGLPKFRVSKHGNAYIERGSLYFMEDAPLFPKIEWNGVAGQPTITGTNGALIINTNLVVGGIITGDGQSITNIPAANITGLSTSGSSNITDSAFTAVARNVLVSTNLTIRSDGIGVNLTNALVLTNGTSAAAGAPQQSPALTFVGQGWRSGNSSTMPVAMSIYGYPAQGSGSNPRGRIYFAASISNAAPVTAGYIDSLGDMSIASFTLTGSGTAGASGAWLWSGRSQMFSPADGTINFTKNDGTTLLQANTNGTLYLPTNVVVGAAIFMQTNVYTPSPLSTGGWLWNSNQVLYWVTSTKTNVVSDGR